MRLESLREENQLFESLSQSPGVRTLPSLSFLTLASTYGSSSHLHRHGSETSPVYNNYRATSVVIASDCKDGTVAIWALPNRRLHPPGDGNEQLSATETEQAS